MSVPSFSLVALLMLLSACSSVAPVAGAVAGVTSAAFTANPAVAYAVATSVNAATDAAVKYAARQWHQGEQQALASAIGQLSDERIPHPWSLDRAGGLSRVQGTLTVVRAFKTPLAICREAVLNIAASDSVQPVERYTVYACWDRARWRWANAEPAVSRWGGLQ